MIHDVLHDWFTVALLPSRPPDAYNDGTEREWRSVSVRSFVLLLYSILGIPVGTASSLVPL